MSSFQTCLPSCLPLAALHTIAPPLLETISYKSCFQGHCSDNFSPPRSFTQQLCENAATRHSQSMFCINTEWVILSDVQPSVAGILRCISSKWPLFSRPPALCAPKTSMSFPLCSRHPLASISPIPSDQEACSAILCHVYRTYTNTLSV